MKSTAKTLKVIGYVILTGTLMTLLAVAANASAVWGS
jgi:hypothetical protein